MVASARLSRRRSISVACREAHDRLTFIPWENTVEHSRARAGLPQLREAALDGECS